jgi:hypothetical protein
MSSGRGLPSLEPFVLAAVGVLVAPSSRSPSSMHHRSPSLDGQAARHGRCSRRGLDGRVFLIATLAYKLGRRGRAP